MSILIEGIEMPKSCYVCPFCDYVSARCDAVKGNPYTQESRYEKRDDFCPLIEVPEPHGRLIDADALHKLFEYQWHYLQVLDWNENPTAEAKQSGINWCINTMHDDAPTVIPASEEGE